MLQQTTIIQWPMSQEFMGEDGFGQNAALCNSEGLLNEYGGSAYAVNDAFLEDLADSKPDWFARVIGIQQTFKGPDIDFEQLQAQYGNGLMMI